MRRFVSFLCSLAMICSMVSVPVCAAEQDPVAEVKIAESQEIQLDAEIERQNPRDLFYKEGHVSIGIGELSLGQMSTPDSGRPMRIWLRNDGVMRVRIEQKNWLGVYSTVYDHTFAVGNDHNVEAISSCSARECRIYISNKDSSNAYIDYAILIYQP